MCYVIKVREEMLFKYLFNTRVLVHEIRLAKTFSSVPLAKRYWKKTVFTQQEYTIVPVPDIGVINL